MRYRSLTEHDRELLVDATVGNVNWCGERFTREDVLGNPKLRRYTELDTARGDFGVVVLCGERIAAVGWALYLPMREPGYGFLDGDTPEFGVWVSAGARGRGVGRALTVEFLVRAVERGVGRVSLSVEPGNVKAVALYRSLGFIPVERGRGRRDALGSILIGHRSRCHRSR